MVGVKTDRATLVVDLGGALHRMAATHELRAAGIVGWQRRDRVAVALGFPLAKGGASAFNVPAGCAELLPQERCKPLVHGHHSTAVGIGSLLVARKA